MEVTIRFSVMYFNLFDQSELLTWLKMQLHDNVHVVKFYEYEKILVDGQIAFETQNCCYILDFDPMSKELHSNIRISLVN